MKKALSWFHDLFLKIKNIILAHKVLSILILVCVIIGVYFLFKNTTGTEAGNRGAHRAQGRAIGATIKLPFEQHTNKYVTDVIPFYYFFTRKLVMRYSAELAIYCPGGFGTMDELFEVITLVQTNKIKKLPIVLFGSEFWNPLDAFIKKTLLDEYGTISPNDRNLYIITDDIDTVVEIAAAADIKKNIDPENILS